MVVRGARCDAANLECSAFQLLTGDGAFRIRHLVFQMGIDFRFGRTHGLLPPFAALGVRGSCGGGLIPKLPVNRTRSLWTPSRLRCGAYRRWRWLVNPAPDRW